MFEKIISLILELIPILHPDDLQKIKNEIEKKEKENEEKRKKLVEAIANGDADTINILLNL